MLERPELAGVVFGTGLVLVLIGLIGLSTNSAVNYGFAIAGVVIAVLGVVWWRMLRRSGY